MRKRLIVAILTVALFIFAFIVSGGTGNGVSKAFLTPDNILDGWESTYGSINSMRVSYVEKVLETYTVNADGSTKLDDHMKNLSKLHNIERTEAGQLYHLRYSKSKNGFENLGDLHESAFNGQYKKEYVGLTHFGTIQRGLTGDTRETMNHLKIYLISEPTRSKEETEKDEPIFSYLLKQGIKRGEIKVEPKMESVAGELCHVVNIGNEIKMWVNHAKGMMVMKHQYYSKNKLQVEICIDEVAQTETFSKLWYPKRAHRIVYLGSHVTRYELMVKNFEPDIKVSQEMFSFEFPSGTEVLDKVTGLNYIKGSGLVTPETEKIIEPKLIGDDVKNEPQREIKEDLSPDRKQVDDQTSMMHNVQIEDDKSQNISDDTNGKNWSLAKASILAAAVVIAIILGVTLFCVMRRNKMRKTT
jgi:hypothetical protein